MRWYEDFPKKSYDCWIFDTGVLLLLGARIGAWFFRDLPTKLFISGG
jgi:hypothetical protein